MKNKIYTVPAQIVSIVSTIDGKWNLVFQRIDTIDDTTNPFHGSHKMAVLRCDKFTVKQIAMYWKVECMRKLIGKQVVLKMQDDGTIFEQVMAVGKNRIGGFRAVSQQVPKMVMREAGETMELGVMYVR